MSIQKFTSKVLSKEYLTENLILLSLDSPRDFTFEPGQFVMFTITKDGERKQRAYSILNSPSQKGRLDFAIKFIDGGFASEKFKTTKEQDKFELRGPFGHLAFAKSSPEHWFIGCGCGIAPLHSIIVTYLSKYPKKKFVLLFSVKVKKELLFHDLFTNLEHENSNFTYIPTLTREEWEGKTGRVQHHLPHNMKNKTFYICGVTSLVEDTKKLLMLKGVDQKNIKSERYNQV
ncbi:hypothetical protein COV17_04215 [Candidatus Woesearchaeota archaeon CG10_big_fil_rev_8_21_14_0_10_36_11]|nr:MAG: hypothetical protein COV17_04215 [Candidatus Woesearchaeota archaeon CG10_big_fil_rev_8_21_14_0_10_36_11]